MDPVRPIMEDRKRPWPAPFVRPPFLLTLLDCTCRSTMDGVIRRHPPLLVLHLRDAFITLRCMIGIRSLLRSYRFVVLLLTFRRRPTILVIANRTSLVVRKLLRHVRALKLDRPPIPRQDRWFVGVVLILRKLGKLTLHRHFSRIRPYILRSFSIRFALIVGKFRMEPREKFFVTRPPPDHHLFLVQHPNTT